MVMSFNQFVEQVQNAIGYLRMFKIKCKGQILADRTFDSERSALSFWFLQEALHSHAVHLQHGYKAPADYW